MKTTAAWYLVGLAILSLFCVALPSYADSGSGDRSGSASGGGKGKGDGTGKAKPPAPAPAKPAEPACSGPGMQRRCGGTCVNLQTDDNNCGSCGTVCSGGKHCDGHLFCRDASGNL